MGAIVGDILGSRFENKNARMKNIVPVKELLHKSCRFTDDTVHTVAVAESLMVGDNLTEYLLKWSWRYLNAGYGAMFVKWMDSDSKEPYNSYGNGSAMRVSSIGYLPLEYKRIVELAKCSAEVTHNHPEGIKGVQAIAIATFMANNGYEKWNIKDAVLQGFYPNFVDTTLDEIRPVYSFDATCQGSVPQAILCFLESESYIEAIQLAISLGGDSDTLAAMAGSIAYAYYGEMPVDILNTCYNGILDSTVRKVVDDFDVWIDGLRNDLITFE